MNSLRMAHISDPHFAHITYNFSQFLSKRWLGNGNLILFRHKLHQTDHLASLPKLFASLQVEIVAVTGDCTTTSLDEEFHKAKSFLDAFSMDTLVLPGNHDIYTKESEKARRFYQYFPSSGEDKGVEVKKLKEGFWWIGLHCAYASNLFLSNGKFTSHIEQNLREELSKIPKEDRIILGNHFPLLSTGNPRHDLLGAKRLQVILKEHPQIILYLHGHDHIPYLIDKREEGLPLICNAGSISHLPKGTFYLFEISTKNILWQRFSFDEHSYWSKIEEKAFFF